MKRYFRLLCTTLLLGVVAYISSNVWLDDINDVAIMCSEEPSVDAEVDVSSEDYGTPKFKIIGKSGGGRSPKPTQIDVKVWFELSDGTFVNPLKKTWKRNEQFGVCVVATKPVFVALFQLDATDGAKFVFPPRIIQNSKGGVQAKKEWRLPSPSQAFVTDDDEKDEMMSLVVVSHDWTGIKDELSVDDQGKEPRLTKISENVIKALNDRFALDKRITYESLREDSPQLSPERAEEIVDSIEQNAPFAKFQEVEASMETSNDSDAVCVYLYGTEQVGQWTLTMKKTRE